LYLIIYPAGKYPSIESLLLAEEPNYRTEVTGLQSNQDTRTGATIYYRPSNGSWPNHLFHSREEVAAQFTRGVTFPANKIDFQCHLCL
jgi:hypothetical protein